MRTALSWVAAAVIVAAVSGCGNIFGSDQAVILSVTEINAPPTVPPASSFSVTLTVQTGGCRRFDYIDTDRTQSVANVTVWGRDAAAGRKGVVCPDDIRLEQHTVTFAPPFASTFTIMAGGGAMNPLTVTVEIR